MRQRKESMRDVRSLLAQALEVDAATLKFQEHHLEHHIAHIASSYYRSRGTEPPASVTTGQEISSPP